MRRILLLTGLSLHYSLSIPIAALATPYAPDLRFSRAFHTPGFNDYTQCAGIYQGKLIAGGPFTQFNGNLTGSVARWDDPDWATMECPFDAFPIAIYEFDGKLYVGGQEIPDLNGVTARGMGIYDGVDWTTASLQGGTSVRAFQEHDGVLHVGGNNMLPGSRATAVWTGSVFQNPGSTLPGTVNAFTLYGGDLIAAGYFSEEGGNGITSVGRYDGAVWSSLDSGLGSGGSPANARTATLFEGDLIVAGTIDNAGGTPVHNVARWNGTAWSDMGTELASPTAFVWDLEVYQNELYACLGFTTVLTQVPNVLKWNGTNWYPAGTGHPFGAYRRLFSLQAHDGRLYAFGYGGVAAWDGASWSEVGSKRDGGWLDDTVFDLVMYKGSLVACGRFTHAGGVPVNHIARWGGTRWYPLAEGRSTPVTMAVHDGELYAGGQISSNFKIGIWDGFVWRNLETGPDIGFVHAMASFNGDLIVGGGLDMIGGVAVNNIARWDGSQWHALGEGVSGCDSPYIPNVQSLEVVDGSLYVGGTFTQAGLTGVGHVARWDGTNWYRLGMSGGITDPCTIQWLDDVWSTVGVYALEPYGSGVALGGHFGTVNNQSSPLAGLWQAGWSSLGGNHLFDSWLVAISDLANHNGTLYAVGNMHSPGNMPPDASAFSRWTGSAWEPVGITGSRYADAIVSDGNFVYVAGDFIEAGGISSGGIAAWSDLPISAVPGPVDAGAPAFPILTVRPNPSSGNVTVRFSLAATGSAAVDVFDVAGRQVKSFAGRLFDPGFHEMTWDGRDDQGRSLPSGVYFVKLKTDEGSRIQRVVRTN